MPSFVYRIYRLLLLVIYCSFILSTSTFAQATPLSWNIENLGKSKSDQQIAFIATTIQDFDLIAIQEVVAGYGGAQAVTRLAGESYRAQVGIT
jgi:hypothetical protein